MGAGTPISFPSPAPATNSDASNASETESEKREDYEGPPPSDRDPRLEDGRRRPGAGRGRGPAPAPRGGGSKHSTSSISSGMGSSRGLEGASGLGGGSGGIHLCLPHSRRRVLPANRPFLSAVLRDPDSNPYSLLENTEAEQAGDTDASESQPLSNRRRRSRRRRTDDDTTVMDGALESDSTSVNENGTGEQGAWVSLVPTHPQPPLEEEEEEESSLAGLLDVGLLFRCPPSPHGPHDSQGTPILFLSACAGQEERAKHPLPLKTPLPISSSPEEESKPQRRNRSRRRRNRGNRVDSSISRDRQPGKNPRHDGWSSTLRTVRFSDHSTTAPKNGTSDRFSTLNDRRSLPRDHLFTIQTLGE